MQVHFYGVVRDLVQEPVVALDLPPKFTLGTMVDALASQCGEQLRSGLISSSGYLQGYVKVFVDGRDAHEGLTEMFTTDSESDRRIDVYVVPMLAGGAV